MQDRRFSEAARSFADSVTRTFLALLLILVLGVQACASGKSGQGSSSSELNVMTFNIRYGNADDKENSWPNRREMVFGVLREQAPDVVGLQEALRFQIDEIRAALPQYGEIGVGREDGKAGGEYSAILYRKDCLALDDSGTFWLSDTPEVPGSISWNSACRRVCTWGRFISKDSGPAFYLFNTHLDHRSQPARQNGAILLSRRIVERKHADPVILTGDFNAGEDNPAVQYLKGLAELAAPDGLQSKTSIPLVDSFRVAHPTEQVVGTFHDFQGGVDSAKIDYIFVQPGVEVKTAKILHDNKDGRYPSDHFPVIAVLHFVDTAGQ
jgi:endonuclease/exonuclease/phosphatase family metal-dependent hydrolase